MNSPFLALLLIVNLLACPLRCLSCEANVTAVEDCVPVACSCCSHCDQASVPQTPEPCGDDCGCQNCICEGAVIEATVDLPDADRSVSWLKPLLLPTFSVSGQSEFTARCDFAPCRQLLCGRDRCVAHQSWLI